MFSDRIFQIAFLVSLITHGVILFQNANFNILPNNKKEEKLEVSYIKEPKKPLEYPRLAQIKKEPLLKLPAKITAEKRILPPFIDKENIFNANKETISRPSGFTKPALIKTDVIAVKKKITLPPIDMNKINSPSYISYYQIVREKIKRAAYQNYTGRETGEVALSFVISNDGHLSDIRLIETKSSSSLYLREIALKSVKDASPFPNFPKELDYFQLSFNVIISFEIE